MLADVNRRLQEIDARQAEREGLTAQFQTEQLHLENARSRLRNLQAQAQSASEAVRELEGLSLTGILSSLRGNKVERRRAANDRLAELQNRLEQARDALTAQEAKVQDLTARRSELDGLDGERERLLAEKERLITSGGAGGVAGLAAIDEELSGIAQDKQHVSAALGAGEQALECLRGAQGSLGSARSWGTYDLLGGGLLATMAKHDKLSDARRQAEQAGRMLQRFHDVLGAGSVQLPTVEIGSFEKFADYFFDGLIADWAVQSKIRNAQQQMSGAARRVERAVTALQAKLMGLDERAAELTRRRRSLIEQA
jgi:chromosome segregation ATPase